MTTSFILVVMTGCMLMSGVTPASAINGHLVHKWGQGDDDVNNDDNEDHDGAANASVTSTRNARGPYYSRFTAIVSHVTPAQPGPFGWAPNPLAVAAGSHAEASPLFSPTPVMEALQPTATPATASSSGVETPPPPDAFPTDFPSGSMTSMWGTSVEDRHAAWLWGLKYRGYTLFQWIRYLAKFSLWEWSTQCSQTEAQGQMWTDVE